MGLADWHSHAGARAYRAEGNRFTKAIATRLIQRTRVNPHDVGPWVLLVPIAEHNPEYIPYAEVYEAWHTHAHSGKRSRLSSCQYACFVENQFPDD